MKNEGRSNRKLEAITYKTIVVGIDIAKNANGRGLWIIAGWK